MAKTVLLGNLNSNNLSKTNGNVAYAFIADASDTHSNVIYRMSISPVDGQLSTLKVKSDAAPGANNSWTFTVMVGVPGSMAATAMEVVIDNTYTPGTTVEYSATKITVPANQAIAMRITTAVGGSAPPSAYGGWGVYSSVLVMG